MASIITFGRFRRKEHWDRDKEIFIKYLKELVYRLTDDKVLSEKDNELEIAGPLKQILKEQNTFFNLIFPDFLSSFMAHMGLSYYNLTKQEKKEILEMEFTFENWKNKTITMSNNYIEKAKKICPLEIQFCLDDPIFIFYVQVDKHQEFKLNNFLSFIRDYYILEESKDILEKFYEPNKFNENRNKIIEEYPKLKEKYGKNKTLDKFLSYIGEDSDYKYEIVRNILEEYDKRKKKMNSNKLLKNEENINLKDKLD